MILNTRERRSIELLDVKEFSRIENEHSLRYVPISSQSLPDTIPSTVKFDLNKLYVKSCDYGIRSSGRILDRLSRDLACCSIAAYFTLGNRLIFRKYTYEYFGQRIPQIVLRVDAGIYYSITFGNNGQEAVISIVYEFNRKLTESSIRKIRFIDLVVFKNFEDHLTKFD